MAKVLIVEDDQFISKMYQKKFEVRGYQVELAHDGQEGLEKMTTFVPSLVLLDIMMPRLNGLDVLDIIMKDDQLKKIPVIVLTNLSTTADADTAIKKGAVKYIIKSEYTPTQVVEAVEKVLLKPRSS